jgi:hypothetical protein
MERSVVLATLFSFGILGYVFYKLVTVGEGKFLQRLISNQSFQNLFSLVSWLALSKIVLLSLRSFNLGADDHWVTGGLGLIGILGSLQIKNTAIFCFSLIQVISLYYSIGSSLHSSVDYLMLLFLAHIGILCYLLARLLNQAFPALWIKKVLVFYGIVIIFLVLIGVSDSAGAPQTVASSFKQFSQGMNVLTITSLGALTLLVLLGRAYLLKVEIWFGVGLIFLLHLVFYVDLSAFVTFWLIVSNILAIVFPAGVAYLGLLRRDKLMINFGSILMLIMVMIKFYDLGYKFLDRSLFALLAGLFFILAGLLLTHFRNSLIRRLDQVNDAVQ